MPVVKLSRLGPGLSKPQQVAMVVVVVEVVVLVVVLVVLVVDVVVLVVVLVVEVVLVVAIVVLVVAIVVLVVEVVVLEVVVVGSVTLVVVLDDVVVVLGPGSVVVVGPGHVQSPWQMPVNAPVHELPGGSHCSPPSIVPLPQSSSVVLVVVVVVVTVGSVVEVVGGSVVDVVEVVVVVGPPGQVQSPWQMPVNAPVHELPGGSHCSPASIVPLPQFPIVVVVVEIVVVVVVDGVSAHASASSRPLRMESAANVPTRAAPSRRRSLPLGAHTLARTCDCRSILPSPPTTIWMSHGEISTPGPGPT
jgi:hypothetical protein